MTLRGLLNIALLDMSEVLGSPHALGGSGFEAFTGWHGLTQFFNRKAKTTCLEEMQARLAA